MNIQKLKDLTTLATLFFGLNTLLPFTVTAQVSTSSNIGQTIDASGGALTMPCALNNFLLDSVTINSPAPNFSTYYINPKTPDEDLVNCGGTGITVQDTRYSGGFVLQVTATEYVDISNPANTIAVDQLAVVTEQTSASYNEDSSSANSFTGSGDVLISGTTGDTAEASQALPFTFTFYGQDYNTVYVCSNGEINFSSSQCAAVSSPLNGRLTATGPRILGYYKDLTTDTGIDGTFGVYYVSPSSTEARFRWKGAPVDNTGQVVEFEITLRDNGTDDRIEIDYGGALEITDDNPGPVVGITKGGAASGLITTTYTESTFSQHAAATELVDTSTIFVPAGVDFTEVKKPGTPAATAPQKGDPQNTADYNNFTEDSGNPGTSLALDLIDGTVDDTCSDTPGRVGIYTVYPSFELTVPNLTTEEGSYQNDITYTISDSTNPPPSC